MNAPEDNDQALALLRDLPVEVSLEQVAHMVAAFPLAVGATGFLAALKTNLNTILIMTIGTLIIATATYFAAAGTTDAQTDPVTRIPEPPALAPIVEAVPLQTAQPAAALILSVADTAPAQAAIKMLPPPTPPAPIVNVAVPPVAPLAPLAPAPPAPVLAPATAQTGSNEKTFDLRDFNAVASFSSADIFIEEGPWKVTASGDPKHLELLAIVVENGVLKVSMKNKKGISFNNKEGLKVDVHLPQLTRLDQGGSGNISVGDLGTTKDLAVNVMGSGDIDVKSVKVSDTLSLLVQGSGDINCRSAIVFGHTSATVLGSGDVKASGTTATIEVLTQGSGNVDVSALQAETGKVSILGSGDASVNCTGKLERLVQGSGSLIEK